jgi:hypothetical protein
MATVKISRLTNAQKNKPNSGTGIFDELMEQVNNHIEYQFDKGRLTGPDFAQVYLGSIQSTIGESIKFLLQEQESDLRAELLEAQVQTELLNQIALRAQISAAEAELPLKIEMLEQQILSETSKRETIDAQLTAFKSKAPLETEILEQQILSETAKRKTLDAQLVVLNSKAPLEDELLERQISNQKSQTDAIVAKIWADKEDHEAKMAMAEELLQTEDGKQAMQAAQIVTEGKKQLLMAAQTLGFKSDTKQKVLKQMLDGYAVNLSIAGTANVPETVLEQSIDQLSQEILTDIGSTVVIQSTVQGAAVEVATP